MAYTAILASLQSSPSVIFLCHASCIIIDFLYGCIANGRAVVLLVDCAYFITTNSRWLEKWRIARELGGCYAPDQCPKNVIFVMKKLPEKNVFWSSTVLVVVSDHWTIHRRVTSICGQYEIPLYLHPIRNGLGSLSEIFFQMSSFTFLFDRSGWSIYLGYMFTLNILNS